VLSLFVCLFVQFELNSIIFEDSGEDLNSLPAFSVAVQNRALSSSGERLWILGHDSTDYQLTLYMYRTCCGLSRVVP
jgi:hypothetical protein